MDLDTLHRTLKAAVERKTFERWRYFIPVPKQEEFMAAGAKYPERLLMAGNGNGKTETAAYEVSRHLTGEYPPWWKGYRFTKPTRTWVTGASATAVRDAAQTKLCGQPGNQEMFGSGFIPKDAFVGEPKASRSAPDAFESFQVRCRVNGRNDESAVSRVVVKTYEQDRRHWQGPDIDFLWCDEEPPPEIYTEGKARLRGRGRSAMTFTPLLGMSDVVCLFMEQDDPSRILIRMGIKDATFYTEEERQNQINAYPAHERAARANGDPLLGQGKVFTTPDVDLKEPVIPLMRVPLHWAKLWGFDFGGGSETAHPFAAVLMAWDRDQVQGQPVGAPALKGPVGTVHILHAIRMSAATIVEHVAAVRKVAAGVPVAWPHDGHVKERSSGEPIAAIYRKHGLSMLDTHATHPDGGFSLYAGITDLDDYMKAGQFKVNETLGDWFAEYGQYHYKDGQIVKVRDDLMSATRIAHMMRRRARAVPLGPKAVPRERDEVARDQDDWLADF